MEGLNLEVEVICLCNAKGELRPLRFRFEDEAHALHTVQITQIVSSKLIEYVGIEAYVYLCRAECGGQERMYELKYTIRTHRWCLFRIIY